MYLNKTGTKTSRQFYLCKIEWIIEKFFIQKGKKVSFMFLIVIILNRRGLKVKKNF